MAGLVVHRREVRSVDVPGLLFAALVGEHARARDDDRRASERLRDVTQSRATDLCSNVEGPAVLDDGPKLLELKPELVAARLRVAFARTHDNSRAVALSRDTLRAVRGRGSRCASREH